MKIRKGCEPWRLREVLLGRLRPGQRTTGADAQHDEITFLVPHFNSPELLGICLHAIRKFYPASRIVVADATSHRAQYLEAREQCSLCGAELHTVYGKHGHSWLLHYLFRQVSSPIAVCLDQDCILLTDLEPLVERVRSGLILCGPADYHVLDHPHYRPYGAATPFRGQPEFVHPSLMVLNVPEVRRLVGRQNPFRWPASLGPEPQPAEGPYGLSALIRQHAPDALLLLRTRHTGYGVGSLYLYEGTAVAYHNWCSSPYGDIESRPDMPVYDWICSETKRFLTDYRLEKVDFELEAE